MFIDKIKAALEKVLWAEMAGAPWWRRALLRPARILYAVIRDLADGQINLRAMSLVYTTLLSLVPLLAITFSVLKGFGVHSMIEPLLLRAFAPLGEQGAEIAQRIIGFVNNMEVGVLGSVGLGLLIFTVISLMQKIERSLNDIWQVPQDRAFAERFSGYLSILVIGPVLVFSALGLTASIGHSSVVQAIAEIEPFGELLHAAGRLLPYLMIIVAFTGIYKLMPNTHVRWLSALTGGIVAGVLWETIGWAFAAYVVQSSNYPAIYSAFATLLLFMIWLYVSWVIVLIGAAVAFYHQHPEHIGTRRGQLLLSMSALESLAVGSAVLIAQRFCSGEPAPSLPDLARRFQVPEKIVEQLLGALQRSGYVAPLGSEAAGYVPARPPETIAVADVRQAVRNDGRGDARMAAALTAQPAVMRVAAASEEAVRQALGGLSLRDLALDETPESAAAATPGSAAPERPAARLAERAADRKPAPATAPVDRPVPAHGPGLGGARRTGR